MGESRLRLVCSEGLVSFIYFYFQGIERRLPEMFDGKQDVGVAWDRPEEEAVCP